MGRSFALEVDYRSASGDYGLSALTVPNRFFWWSLVIYEIYMVFKIANTTTPHPLLDDYFAGSLTTFLFDTIWLVVLIVAIYFPDQVIGRFLRAKAVGLPPSVLNNQKILTAPGYISRIFQHVFIFSIVINEICMLWPLSALRNWPLLSGLFEFLSSAQSWIASLGKEACWKLASWYQRG